MKVVFLSLTSQTRKFVKKLGLESIEIKQTDPFITVEDDFIIVAPSYEKEATEVLEDFIETGDNTLHCKGVVGTGNRNFANLFCYTARDLAVDYDLPYLHELEFQGSERDVKAVLEIIHNIQSNTCKYLTPKEQGYYGTSKGTYTYTDFKVVKESI